MHVYRHQRTSLLVVLVVALWSVSQVGLAIGDDQIKRPNIVWIVAENFCHDFGCYGARNVHTPNVDRLAAEGVRYTNVFSTSPVCATWPRYGGRTSRRKSCQGVLLGKSKNSPPLLKRRLRR